MKSIFVEIFDPDFKSLYPTENVEANNMGYFVWNNIPGFYYETSDFFQNYSLYRIKKLHFFCALLLTKYSFPAYCFSPWPTISINLVMKEFNSLLISDRLNELLSHDTKIKNYNYTNRKQYVKHDEFQVYCSQNEFIDFQLRDTKDFGIEVQKLFNKYNFVDISINLKCFTKLLNMISIYDRDLNISFYYFYNASRLIGNDFIEDAGVNLNLVIEALLNDFMNVMDIKNKTKAIEKFSIILKLKSNYVEWLEELYSARNNFLAHIDKNMFTVNESINDPDSYCFMHYGSIAWLLIRYCHYRKHLFKV